jgi:hypothetical protein
MAWVLGGIAAFAIFQQLSELDDAFFKRKITHKGHLPDTIDSADPMLGLRSPRFWPLAALYYTVERSSIYDSDMCLEINDCLYCKGKDKSEFVKTDRKPKTDWPILYRNDGWIYPPGCGPNVPSNRRKDDYI